MQIIPDKIIQIGNDHIIAIQNAAQAKGIRNEFSAHCSNCDFSGTVSPVELFDTCPKCTPVGDSCELLVQKDDYSKDMDNTDPPYLWANEVISELGLSLWLKVRQYLENKKTGSFTEFLTHLKAPCKFADIFQILYGKYRENDHISAGFRTAAWDMLAITAEKAFPEYEDYDALTTDLEIYAATVRNEWKEKGMDVIVMDEWQEIAVACDMYLESAQASASAFALGLGYLVIMMCP